jgi:fluoride exporter
VERWYQVAALSLGGVFGVNARYWLGVVINRWTGPRFPWATFSINVSGSFAIGLLSVVLVRWLPLFPNARLFVVVGFLGGYTTFSSFTFEALALWERGEWWLSLAYMAGSLAAGFAAVILGTVLGRELSVPSAERASPADHAVVPQSVPSFGAAMIPSDAQLLTIHVGGNRRHDGKYLYASIVDTARAMNLAGASVFPVAFSYGSHGRIHDDLSDYSFVEMPVLIEIVERPERVRELLSALDAMIAPAMVTIEPVRIVRYSHTERP